MRRLILGSVERVMESGSCGGLVCRSFRTVSGLHNVQKDRVLWAAQLWNSNLQASSIVFVTKFQVQRFSRYSRLSTFRIRRLLHASEWEPFEGQLFFYQAAN